MGGCRYAIFQRLSSLVVGCNVIAKKLFMKENDTIRTGSVANPVHAPKSNLSFVGIWAISVGV
jgi:hypothetical protein